MKGEKRYIAILVSVEEIKVKVKAAVDEWVAGLGGNIGNFSPVEVILMVVVF